MNNYGPRAHRRQEFALAKVLHYWIRINQLWGSTQVKIVRFFSKPCHRAPSRAFQVECASLIWHAYDSICDSIKFAERVQPPHLKLKFRPIRNKTSKKLTILGLTRMQTQTRGGARIQRTLHRQHMRYASESSPLPFLKVASSHRT